MSGYKNRRESKFTSFPVCFRPAPKASLAPPGRIAFQNRALPPYAQQPFGAEHRPAGRQRHRQQPGAQIRQKHSYRKARHGRNGAGRAFQNGGHRHGCQHGVGHIVKEALHKAAFYFPAHQKHGQRADEISGARHHGDVTQHLYRHAGTSVSFTGASHAKAIAAHTVHRMMEKPEEMCACRNGTYRTRQLSAAASAATPSTGRCAFAAGTTMATNMPYSATPMALCTLCGSRAPATAPARVPSAQPR